MFHPPVRPTVWSLRGEKGVPLDGIVPLFPQRYWSRPSFSFGMAPLSQQSYVLLGRGAAVEVWWKFYPTATEPPGKGAGTPNVGRVVCCLSYTTPSPATDWRLFSNTEQSCGDKQTLLSYVIKKRSSISCSFLQVFFVWELGVSASRICTFPSQVSSYRCRLNEEHFWF